ncbi:Isthmin-1, partial [Dufourea novaeangliae]
QPDDDETSRNLDDIVTGRSALRLLPSSWISIPLRSKRNDEVEEETLPTRHAKHRKRRRCRNRSACSRGTVAKLYPSRQNDTKNDRDVTNAVSEQHEGERSIPGTNIDRAREMNNETKGERNGSGAVDDPLGSELIESYDERGLLEDIEFEDTNMPSWIDAWSKKDKRNRSDDYGDETRSTSIYMAIDDQVTFHEGLGVLLSKLFQSLRNASAVEGRDIFKELNFVNATNEDPCQKWLNSRDKLEKVFLGGLATLPGCPCQYPSNIFYDDKIWDERLARHFRWRDVSGGSQRLDVYKPGAAYCVRSLLTQESGSAAAQHCCYDRRRRLLTRGSGAGTPNFVSPEISPILHERIDVLPWRLCKGDFSRYNGVRPPNNDNGCDANPDDEEYQRQIDNTKYY